MGDYNNGNLKLDGLVKGPNLCFFTVTSQKVREEFNPGPDLSLRVLVL